MVKDLLIIITTLSGSTSADIKWTISAFIDDDN